MSTKPRALAFSVLAIAVAAVALLNIVPAQALSGSEFNPGRIIDDGVFENKNSMSPGAIQDFLNAKVPTCDNWGTQPYAGTTRRAYSEARGIKFPLTCVKDYYENTTTHENNLEGRAIPSGAKSAAQIIYEAGQQYNINPQVLIVLIQKEQGLTADDWPWPVQYQSATGYGCPDTAPCDSQYYGFYNQVNNAARQFRRYANYPNDYNYVAKQNNTILWSPTVSCGTSTVYIQNQSTASLYNYTPYRPNQAALDNVYGSGDSCSSYGNRNFWRYFRDWFGSVYADPFMWQPTDLVIMDENKNVPMGTDQLHKGERLFVTVKGKNEGTEIWYRDGPNPANFGRMSPLNGTSHYCDTFWLRWCDRPATLNEAVVAPGDTFHFNFYIHAPNEGGVFREYFMPVLENRAWMQNDTGFHIYVNSTDYYDWSWGSYGAWTDSSKSTPVDMNNLAKGQQVYIELRALNKSATVWTNSGSNPTRLGLYPNKPSVYCDPSWMNCWRPATQSEATVNPGQTATFKFTLKAPMTNGEYREYFKPVIEDKGWMRDDFNHMYLKVTH